MRLENLIQLIALAAVWGAIILVQVILAILSLVINSWTMPVWWILVFFVVGFALSVFMLTTDRFKYLKRQIEDKLTELSDEEMLEVLQGLDELRDELGISIELPLKSKKNKREAVDRAVRNLSDTELLHLRDQLRNGEIDENRLNAWLDAQRNDDSEVVSS